MDSIYRGDTFRVDITASLKDGTVYEFQQGDTIKVGIKSKLSNAKCACLKTINIEEAAKVVNVVFPHDETKRWCEGEKILEVELTDTQGNVYTLSQEKLKIVGDVINE